MTYFCCNLSWPVHQGHTHPFNGPLSGTTRVSRYQKGTINLDFTVARDSGWQCHQLGHMQVCTSLQTDNHASTPPLSFYKHCRHIKLKLDWQKSKAKLTATFTAPATFCALVVVCMNIHMLHQYWHSWKTFLTLATDVNVYWAVCLLAAIQPTSACKRFVTCAA